MESRIHTEIPSKIIETKNGMRQPQSPKATSPISNLVDKITNSDRNNPKVAVVCIHAVNCPRWLSGACSAT